LTPKLPQVPYSALQRQNEAAISALRRAGKAVVARGVTGRGVDVALVATTDDAHLAADIGYAAKGALDQALFRSACRRLEDAGGGSGQDRYRSGGPSPVP
jgi:hypothetical protein